MLPERLVALVVLGLIPGLVIAHGPAHSHGLDLIAAACQVTGALRLACSRAIAEERAVMVIFAEGGYRIDADATVAWSADVPAIGNRAIDVNPDGGSSGRIASEVDWLSGRIIMRRRRGARRGSPNGIGCYIHRDGALATVLRKALGRAEQPRVHPPPASPIAACAANRQRRGQATNAAHRSPIISPQPK